jgi:N-acetylmuramoyl-L-alanine amidase
LALAQRARYARSMISLRTVLATLSLSLALWPGAAHAQRRARDAQASDDGGVERALAHEGRARRWRHIVLHHSATPGGNVAAFEAWHRSGSRRFALGMAYHFVIGNGRGMRDGELVAGSRWRRQQQGAHIAARLRDEQTGANLAAESIGVCLVGNFENAAPTRAQLATLRRLVRVLRQRYAIAAERVRGHGEVHPGHTACPGRGLRSVRRALGEEGAEPTASAARR